MQKRSELTPNRRYSFKIDSSNLVPNKYFSFVSKKNVYMDIYKDTADIFPRLTSVKGREPLKFHIPDDSRTREREKFTEYWNHMIAANKIIFPLKKALEKVRKNTLNLNIKHNEADHSMQEHMSELVIGTNHTENFIEKTNKLLKSIQSPSEVYNEALEKEGNMKETIINLKSQKKTQDEIEKLIKKLDLSKSFQKEGRKGSKTVNPTPIKVRNDISSQDTMPQIMLGLPHTKNSANASTIDTTQNKASPSIMITNQESEQGNISPTTVIPKLPVISQNTPKKDEKYMTQPIYIEQCLEVSNNSQSSKSTQKQNHYKELKAFVFETYQNLYNRSDDTPIKSNLLCNESSSLKLSNSALAQTQSMNEESLIEILVDPNDIENYAMTPKQYSCRSTSKPRRRLDNQSPFNASIMSKIIMINEDTREQTLKDLKENYGFWPLSFVSQILPIQVRNDYNTSNRVLDDFQNQIHKDADRLKKDKKNEVDSYMYEHVDEVLNDIHKERLIHDTDNKWIMSPEFTHMAKKHAKRYIKQRLGVTKAVIRTEKKNLDRSIINLQFMNFLDQVGSC